jgi:hypothetical protein
MIMQADPKEVHRKLAYAKAKDELRLRNELVKELLAACEEAIPWVATAMAGRRDKRREFDAHPDAVKNHEKAIAMLQAAIAKAKPVTTAS